VKRLAMALCTRPECRLPVCAHRNGATVGVWRECERPLRGGEFGAANGAEGSGAGVRGRLPTGRCTSHTRTLRPEDRHVQVSGQPPRSGGRCL